MLTDHIRLETALTPDNCFDQSWIDVVFSADLYYHSVKSVIICPIRQFAKDIKWIVRPEHQVGDSRETGQKKDGNYLDKEHTNSSPRAVLILTLL
jgi:hypothetical protein